MICRHLIAFNVDSFGFKSELYQDDNFELYLQNCGFTKITPEHALSWLARNNSTAEIVDLEAIDWINTEVAELTELRKTLV